MMGHTDRATINQRRPMSAGMVSLLRAMARAAVDQDELDQAERSQARALMDRGYATPSPSGWWSATAAGLARLAELDHAPA